MMHPVPDGFPIVCVGVVVPEDQCECLSACSIAGNQFQLNVIRELETLSPRPIHVIAIKPLPMYPKGREIVVSSETYVIGKERECHTIPYVNLPLIKQIVIAWAVFWRLLVTLWPNRAESPVVIVYTVFSPLSLPVLAATKLLGARSLAIVAELPFSYNFQGIRGFVERLDFLGQTRSLAHYTGLVVLTRKIMEDFAQQVPSLVMEGGIGPEKTHITDTKSEMYPNHNQRICLYSGTLNEVNGIQMLLEAFDQISNPDYRLWIFGKGPLESAVQEASRQDQRVVYWGSLPNVRVRAYQLQATVLINPRPSHLAITRYTFPSKLLEYLASGRPTITTVLSGIPDDYYPYLYLLRDETPDGLARLIQKVCAEEPSVLEDFGRRAQEFVFNNKNWDRQGQRIYDFISAL